MTTSNRHYNWVAYVAATFIPVRYSHVHTISRSAIILTVVARSKTVRLWATDGVKWADRCEKMPVVHR